MATVETRLNKKRSQYPGPFGVHIIPLGRLPFPACMLADTIAGVPEQAGEPHGRTRERARAKESERERETAMGSSDL